IRGRRQQTSNVNCEESDMGRRRGNREGTIYRRTDGRWSGQVTVAWDPISGRATRRTVYGETRAEVVQKLEEVKKQAAEITGPEISLKGAIEMKLIEDRTRVDPVSARRYETSLAPVLADPLVRRPVATLSAFDLTQLQGRLLGAHSPNQVRSAMSHLRRLFTRCMDL